MNVLNTALIEEINSYFQCDWEDHYRQSHKVRAIKDEMDKLVEKLYEADKLARLNEAYARSVVGLKSTLQKKKLELIAAIDQAKNEAAATAARQQSIAQEKRRLELAEEANTISKKSQRLSRISIAISASVALASIATQAFLNLTKEERLITAATNRIGETAIEPIRAILEKHEQHQGSLTDQLNIIAAQLKAEKSAAHSPKNPKSSLNKKSKTPPTAPEKSTK